MSINSRVAPLQNVSLFTSLLERVTKADDGSPSLGVFYSPSGFGKTTAAVYGANKFRARYVRAAPFWTRKTLCEELLKAYGQPAKGSIANMMSKICEVIALDDAPLIIDEADFIARSESLVEQVRYIYDTTYAPIVMIGEENLPFKFEKFERFHNRVLDWVGAVPSDQEDARMLLACYTPDLKLADDLLAFVVEKSGGRARRIVTNIKRIEEQAGVQGWKEVDLKMWGSRTLFTGQTPARRVV